MKKVLLALPLFLLLSVPSHSKEKVYKTYTDIGELDPPSVTISQVLSSPDEFHRKIFTVEGQVSELQFKKMANGRKFTLFRFFEDDPEKRINVYARGFVEGIEEGSRIRVWGRYSKHKRYFLAKRKNIMKAKKIHILQGTHQKPLPSAKTGRFSGNYGKNLSFSSGVGMRQAVFLPKRR